MGFALLCVTLKGCALQHFSAKVRQSREVALAAVENDAAVLPTLADELRCDDSFLAEALLRNPIALHHLPHSWGTWSHLAHLVLGYWIEWMERGRSFRDVPLRLRSDRQFLQGVVERIACRKYVSLAVWRHQRKHR